MKVVIIYEKNDDFETLLDTTSRILSNDRVIVYLITDDEEKERLGRATGVFRIVESPITMEKLTGIINTH